MTHIKQLVMPYVKKLKESTLTQIQQMFLGFIESNLTRLATPLLKNLHAFRLTSHQLEIATLIREGMATKDIARILNMNERAVETQRYFIRKKLGINKDNTNLQAYLKSFS